MNNDWLIIYQDPASITGARILLAITLTAIHFTGLKHFLNYHLFVCKQIYFYGLRRCEFL